jgi:hypothetical protein
MNTLNKSSNGRIDILNPPDISNLFAMYDKIPANQCTSLRNATIGQWDETQLSRAFFSEQNIQIIQDGIRAGVYKKSNGQYTVGPQDCEAIKIIMRSTFLSYATNLPQDIPQQIAELNAKVLDYCVENVFAEAQSYMKYLQDVSTLPVPISAPVMASQRDKNTYKMPSWF